MLDINQHPLVTEAFTFERDQREEAFLGVPEILCGVEVWPLNLLACLRLLRIGSPFLCGHAALATPENCVAFVWLVSAGYRCDQSRAARKARQQCAATVGEQKLVRDEIAKFVEASFMDDPPTSDGQKHRTPFTSFAATYVHIFALEYGWTEKETLNLPLTRLFQYLREITLRKDPKAILFNKRSDRAKLHVSRLLRAAAETAATAGEQS